MLLARQFTDCHVSRWVGPAPLLDQHTAKAALLSTAAPQQRATDHALGARACSRSALPDRAAAPASGRAAGYFLPRATGTGGGSRPFRERRQGPTWISQ